MKIILLAILLLMPGVTQAETIFGPAQVETPGFDFQGLRFGQSPPEDMICIRGVCGDETAKSVGHNPDARILASYKRAQDLSFLGRIEISAPQYDFFENQLVRVMFTVDCRKAEQSRCLEEIVQHLTSRDAVVPRDEFHRVLTDGSEIQFTAYEILSGIIMEIHQGTVAGRRKKPIVKIFDEKLMTKVRVAANPNYEE